MTLRTQVAIWLVMLGLTIIGVWLLRGILLPFIVGLLLAYLLDPAADALERLKVPRMWAALIMVGVVVGVVVLAFFLVVPLIVQQIIGLFERLPGYVVQLQALANQLLPELRAWIGAERVAEIETSLTQMTSNLIGIAGNVTTQVAQSGLTLINALGLLVISPVVAFYLLLDWDKMLERVDNLLPRASREEIRGVFRDIDVALAGFIRGQSGVVLVLAAFYATALTLAGLQYGLAIGLVSGLLSFIPYVGFLVGFILSMGVALVQWWPDWVPVAIVLGIYLAGQFLEGNILYPNLVGSSIGVHPVWLMFALFSFALLLGGLGILLAVPLAAITGVLVRYGVRKYKESALYDTGEPPVQVPPAPKAHARRKPTEKA